MKKIAVALCLLTFTQGAFAYIKEGKTSDIQSMQNTGYSQSILKIVDNEKAKVTKEDGYYEKYYQDAVYKRRGKYEKIKLYIDPIQDDGYFGRHEVQFTNMPFADQHEKTKVDNL